MSNRTCVFVGPTLAKSEVTSILPDALILGPAEQGDVDYAHRQLGAEVILLIDGYHTSKLPVWYKEILGVLASGARFLGASSMGALRAVECEPWGAEPVGEIASWYRDGTIEADDEVCLAHGDESTGYRQLSIPMVNIRASMAAADITEERKQDVIDFAKGLFYPDRTWPTIFNACELDPADRAAILESWVDQKAADALQACYFVASLPKAPVPSRKARHLGVGYDLVFRANDTKVPLESGQSIRLHEIADRAPWMHQQALHRMLALEYCKSLGLEPRETCTSVEGLPYSDLSDEERIGLCNDERLLARGREWLVASGGGFHDVPAVLNFMRTIGVYEQMKGG